MYVDIVTRLRAGQLSPGSIPGIGQTFSFPQKFQSIPQKFQSFAQKFQSGPGFHKAF
jgi:hypothetical protein